ncbi:hypothetical protein ACLI08_04200 [Flavobacterium sp. RNTU_13]|uniref:hypothetical protein n=1 Tax=Flavobacterium sp. RNTU_13 TaxID=3375145 RepID=UPI00398821C8
MEKDEIKTSKCTKCGDVMILVHHKFKPPKKGDVAGWKLVKLLLDNGFRFRPVYTRIDKNILLKVNYPKTLEEAKEFIKQYKPD